MKPKLYYGNGICELDANDIILCIITIKYPIEIEDTTPYDFLLDVKKNKIIIMKFRPGEIGILKQLFKYIGDLSIVEAKVYDSSGEYSCIIKRVMDYAELISGKAEEINTNAEDLKITRRHIKPVNKIKLLKTIVPDLKCKLGKFYLSDGLPYEGMYHQHLDSGMYMTESNHIENSKILYFKDVVDGKVIDKLIVASTKNYINRKGLQLKKRSPQLSKRFRKK